MWIFTLLLMNFFILVFAFLRSRRVRTSDGSKLEDKVCTIPSKSIFGNAFDAMKMDMANIFEYNRRNVQHTDGRSYLLDFVIVSVYSVTNAEDAEGIFQNRQLLKKGLIYDMLRSYLGEGLLTSANTKWHLRRKTLTPAFHFNILQSFLDIFIEETNKLIAVLSEQNNQVISLHEVIPKFSLNNICETAMGVKLDEAAGSEQYRQTIHVIETIFVKRLRNPLLAIEPIFHLFGEHKEQKRNIDVAHAFSSRIINNRRQNYQNRMILGREDKIDEFGRKKRYAMLDTLFDAEKDGLINHEGICDEVNTFMFEGYDTTSTCLIFALLNLSWSMDVQEKCYREIQSFSADMNKLTFFDFNNLEYLECVIKETLRLYPSVPLISRQCEKETVVNGLILPKKTQINVHIFDIMRDARHFPDPLVFSPERFLQHNSTQRHPFAFVPFSAGARNCIGKKFALLEMKVLLANIINNFKLFPVTCLKDVVFESGLALRTQQQVQIKLAKRNK